MIQGNCGPGPNVYKEFGQLGDTTIVLSVARLVVRDVIILYATLEQGKNSSKKILVLEIEF